LTVSLVVKERLNGFGSITGELDDLSGGADADTFTRRCPEHTTKDLTTRQVDFSSTEGDKIEPGGSAETTRFRDLPLRGG